VGKRAGRDLPVSPLAEPAACRNLCRAGRTFLFRWVMKVFLPGFFPGLHLRIAIALFVSKHTIDNHRKNIIRKTNSSCFGEALEFCAQAAIALGEFLPPLHSIFFTRTTLVFLFHPVIFLFSAYRLF
jgi:hypothetical protein